MFNILEFFKRLFSRERIGKGTGLVEDPVDHRDILLESIFKKEVPLPENYSIPYLLPIHNQGNKPICVGESGAVIKSEKERREGNEIDFDPDWLYWQCKKIDRMPNFKGTFFRSVFKVLKNTGAKPYKENEFAKYRIGAYLRVKPDFDEIKRAIYEHGVILVGFRISNKGWATADIRKPLLGEKQYGHAVSCVGFTRDKIKFQNSWGSRWGDKGYGYFDKNNMPFSAWCVIIDLPNNLKEILKSYKSTIKYTFKNDLYFGMKNNEEVKILQKVLKSMGCFPQATGETGNYFMITMNAVKIYQSRKGISQVGRFGPKTRKALNSDLST